MPNDTTTSEDERLMQLEQTRFRDILSAEKAVTEVAQRVATKLNELIAQGHDTTAFAIAIGLTLLNDSLDIILGLLGVGDIPLISEIPGWLITGILFYFLWGKGYFNNFKVKVILWGLGFFFESIPFIDWLPATTLSVIMAWHVVRKRGRQAEEELVKVNEMTEEELSDIEAEG